MSQKSSKNSSTLSKHMTNDTKLQLNQNTVTNRLIIPGLAAANPNSVNGELYYNTIYHHLYISCLLNQPCHIDFLGGPKTMNSPILIKYSPISAKKSANSQCTNPQTSPT